MREIPECLNRRYKALDEMIQELSSTLARRGLEGDPPYKSTEDPGIELMCKFWNILKEDPECDLTNEVEQRMRVNMKSSGFMLPQSVACYMAPNVPRRNDNDKQKDLANKVKSGCCTSGSQPVQKDRDSCCGSKSPTPSANADPLPLSKVLCNLKEAASFDKKCNARLNDLMMTQKELQEQITHLEHREREGTQLLKQAECMWSCMEDSYKKKVAESTERQQGLMKHLKEVEKSATKWRKNKKEVESQVYSIHKCQQEIIDKINQKTNDIKCMDMEIEGFKKKIESNKKEISGASQLTTNKKQASTAKVNGIATQVASLQKASAEAAKHRYNKEGEGGNYIKEAREDLQKICRLLLQKKLENEDLRAEKDALLLEIDLLKQTCDQCKDRCKNKQTSINYEIKEVEQAIASFKVKCIRCHECTDTIDIRKFCTDCPKCAEERDCLYDNDHCNPDTTMDCVCMSVKNKFLDNVFDNMYTVLERQARTAPGKAVAEQVLECLKRSRNGKLNEDTRRLLQDFILTTVKKNLNLTIVGGAVKTRCEMDPETYQQLMTCLKKVKAERPPKADKGTTSRKDPCRRWGATSECNCPKGPKACICTRKAPPPPQDPTPCPPKDKEDAGEEVKCPFKGTTACGPDCAMHAVPSLVGTDVAAWRPDPCQGQSCPYSKNMRAAQCVLGPESLVSLPKSKRSRNPNTGISDELITCKCGTIVTKPCSCRSSEYVTKAGIVKNCDKSTCVIISEQEVDDIISEADLITVQDFSSSKVKESNVVQNVDSSNNNLDNVSEKNKALDESTDIKLTYTSSGNIAVEIDENIIYLIERRTEQDPALVVSLKATESGHFFVYFQKNEDISNEHHLIRIKKTLSGSRFLEVHKSFIQSLKPQNISNNERVSQLASKPLLNDSINLPSPDEKLRDIKHVTKEVSEGIIVDNDINLLQRQFFKVRVKRIDSTITELPIILKLVTSRNYEVVIDKEFEKRYINAIQESFGHEMVCSVNLTTTASNNYLIDLKDTCLHESCKRALLKRSLSGHLRMDINGSKINISSISPTETLSQKVLEELLNKLLPCKVIRREMLRKPKLTESKATSDSYLYEKVKIKLNNKILFNEPSAVLRKTSSGQLAVVLNKESKKAFINNLKSYISNKPHGLIPIKRTESGEIIIDLSHDEETKTRYGSLKITPSGNIYVFVDECVAQEIMKRENISKVNESTSLHLIEKNKDPTDKAVTTTCHAKPEEYACDVAKCICDRLQIVTDNKGIYSLDWRNTTLNKDDTCKCCGQNKSPKDWYANNKTTSNEKAPHIVIKPCTCRSVQELKRNVEQCYFVVETICPFHKNRYDSLSNELLEITGPCNKPLESIIKESKVVEFTKRESLSRNVDKEVNAVVVLKETEFSENWDSLQYLPPQLPVFLKDVNYRQYRRL